MNLEIDPTRPPIRLAYLVSEYPAVSHTFILREVRRLRALNFELQVASINSPRQPIGEMAADDREEAAATFYIKREGALRAARAHLRALRQRPGAYFRGLSLALSLGGADLGQLLYSIFYFTEALMLGNWMESRGLRPRRLRGTGRAVRSGWVRRRCWSRWRGDGRSLRPGRRWQ